MTWIQPWEMDDRPTVWLSVVDDFSAYTLHKTEDEALEYANKFPDPNRDNIIIELVTP